MVEQHRRRQGAARLRDRQIVASTDGDAAVRRGADQGGARDNPGASRTHYELEGPFQGIAIPDTLQGSLMARLDRLDPWRSEMAQIGADDRPRVRTAISRAWSGAARRRSWRRGWSSWWMPRSCCRSGCRSFAGPSYAFRHALIQDAAYQSLLLARRRQYHAQIAEALAADYAEMIAGCSRKSWPSTDGGRPDRPGDRRVARRRRKRDPPRRLCRGAQPSRSRAGADQAAARRRAGALRARAAVAAGARRVEVKRTIDQAGGDLSRGRRHRPPQRAGQRADAAAAIEFAEAEQSPSCRRPARHRALLEETLAVVDAGRAARRCAAGCQRARQGADPNGVVRACGGRRSGRRGRWPSGWATSAACST